jgi:hypothetical protein
MDNLLITEMAPSGKNKLFGMAAGKPGSGGSIVCVGDQAFLSMEEIRIDGIER